MFAEIATTRSPFLIPIDLKYEDKLETFVIISSLVISCLNPFSLIKIIGVLLRLRIIFSA